MISTILFSETRNLYRIFQKSIDLLQVYFCNLKTSVRPYVTITSKAKYTPKDKLIYITSKLNCFGSIKLVNYLNTKCLSYYVLLIKYSLCLLRNNSLIKLVLGSSYPIIILEHYHFNPI